MPSPLTSLKPIGKQDQYAAAYGGLNHIRLDANERVSITPISLSEQNLQLLFSSLLLFWTGMTRRAEEVLADQKERTLANIGSRNAICDMADQACELLHEPDLSVPRFGRLLHEAWQLKQRLSPHIAEDRISRWYRRGIEAGAHGGKLCGAGGGGFLLFCAPPERHPAIVAALPELRPIEIAYDRLGTRLLFPDYFERG